MAIIKCEICHLQYRETDVTPRITASCGHTICQQCVTKLSADGRTITCPFDKRQVTIFTSRIGSDGVTKLQENLEEQTLEEVMTELVVLLANLPEKLYGKKADVPCFENETHEAVVHCQQCKVDFCDECFTSVHRPKALSGHQKINISEKPIKLSEKPIKHDFLMERLLKTEQTLKDVQKDLEVIRRSKALIDNDQSGGQFDMKKKDVKRNRSNDGTYGIAFI